MVALDRCGAFRPRPWKVGRLRWGVRLLAFGVTRAGKVEVTFDGAVQSMDLATAKGECVKRSMIEEFVDARPGIGGFGCAAGDLSLIHISEPTRPY